MRIDMSNRPDWDGYFMTMAMLVATRSQDAQWQCGCVMVRDKKVLATGYNSFPRDMPDYKLPKTRPLKYDWMIHSEANAIYNATVPLHGATCYVNGHPCLECLKSCYQNGITNFVVTKGKATMMENYTDHQKNVYKDLLNYGNIQIKEIKIGTSSVERALEIIEKSN